MTVYPALFQFKRRLMANWLAIIDTPSREPKSHSEATPILDKIHKT